MEMGIPIPMHTYTQGLLSLFRPGAACAHRKTRGRNSPRNQYIFHNLVFCAVYILWHVCCV